MSGRIEEILTSKAAGADLIPITQGKLVEGRGIEGDRYYYKSGTFSKALKQKGDFEVTLIELEEIDAFNSLTSLSYAPRAFRRNIVTKGVRLNEYEGKNFILGSTVLFGVRLCEPCAYLTGLLGKEVMAHMVHKAGLRAVIKKGGKVNVGDAVALA